MGEGRWGDVLYPKRHYTYHHSCCRHFSLLHCFLFFFLMLTVAVVPGVALPAATTAVQGNSLTLDCNPIGQPTPTVIWFMDNVQLTSTTRVSVDGAGRLIFSSVISTDAGSYRCEATSSVGTASATTTLSVLGKYDIILSFAHLRGCSHNNNAVHWIEDPGTGWRLMRRNWLAVKCVRTGWRKLQLSNCICSVKNC